jgi:hypothetical protein
MFDDSTNKIDPKEMVQICALDDRISIKGYKISNTSISEGYIDINGMEWVDSTHILYNTKLLTIDDPKYIFHNNDYFTGILYDPQATLLHTMIKLENCQSLRIVDTINADICPIDDNLYTINSNYGVLSVKFSFGKTVLALALICAQKYPLNKPTTFPLLSVCLETESDKKNRMNINVQESNNRYYNNFKLNSPYGFFPEVELYEEDNELLPVTIVAAASSIIIQWENNIKKFTNLKYFIINDVHALKKFDKMVNLTKIVDYDIILVKVGSVTKSYKTIHETVNNIETLGLSTRPIFDAIRSILSNVKISRFIIDDFDVIKLTGNDYLINACFTWFISATRRQSNIKSMQYRNMIPIERNILNNLESPAVSFTSDDVLNNVFNIRCDSNYIDQHINTTNIIFRKIVVKGNKVKLLQNLNISPEIIEMINGDAIGLAAQALGLEVNSIGELIQKIMKTHLTDITYSLKILDRINLLFDTLAISKENTVKESISTENDDEEINTGSKINTIRKVIILTSDEEYQSFICGNQTYIDAKNKNIHISSLNENHIEKVFILKDKMSEQYEKNSIIMNRMRDNIRENHCQCCTLPFEENECAYILGNCCQLIICQDCVTTSNYNQQKTFIKRCPNCSSELMFSDKNSGLIKIGSDINLEDTMTDSIFKTDINIDSIDDSTNDSTANIKIKALSKLIEDNMQPINQSYCISDSITSPYIYGLLVGKQDIPHVGINKILIFSLLTETTNLLAAELQIKRMQYQILHGTSAQKNKIINQFEHDNSNNILLVTATNDCAGMHMPFVSHIIFYHKIIDRNIESQIAARGQRIGRISNLEIISLLYENE